jgi:hypothetical protein
MDQLGHAIRSTEVPPDRARATGVVEYEVTVQMPSTPGRYVARIAATGGRHSVWRDVPVTVR